MFDFLVLTVLATVETSRAHTHTQTQALNMMMKTSWAGKTAAVTCGDRVKSDWNKLSLSLNLLLQIQTQKEPRRKINTQMIRLYAHQPPTQVCACAWVCVTEFLRQQRRWSCFYSTTSTTWQADKRNQAEENLTLWVSADTEPERASELERHR